MFQNYALFPHLTVAANVAFGLEMRKVPRAEIGQRVDEVLALVGLVAWPSATRRKCRAASSSGWRWRAHVTAGDAAARRPLSNLDAELREEMQIELRRIQRGPASPR